MLSITYLIAVTASALWFFAAFRYFSFQHFAAAKVLVPKSARNSPLFQTTAALTRFLGGMNGALGLFSTVLVILCASGSTLFADPMERGVVLVTLGMAHFSQFVFNLPILKNGGRQGESYWPVLNGPMYFIFVMDAFQAVLSLSVGALQFFVH